MTFTSLKIALNFLLYTNAQKKDAEDHPRQKNLIRVTIAALPQSPILARGWASSPFVTYVSRVCLILKTAPYFSEPGESQRLHQNPTESVTKLLIDLSNGDRNAVDLLLPVIYDELRKLAANYLRRERPDHTLQPTALVHEAYLRLVDQTRVNWQNRAHFFGVAAQIMRRLLVDHARKHNAEKRGQDFQKLSLDENVDRAVERSGWPLLTNKRRAWLSCVTLVVFRLRRRRTSLALRPPQSSVTGALPGPGSTVKCRKDRSLVLVFGL